MRNRGKPKLKAAAEKKLLIDLSRGPFPLKLSSAHQHAESHSKAKSDGDELKSISPMKRLSAWVIEALQEWH
jgi:hypothetical protein